MNVLVYGGGAIGSLLIHYLCRAGNDVTVVARSTYEELNRNGLVIRHYLQKKTTVDHPRVIKEYDGSHYDIAFSVMQGQQQLTLLPVLAETDTDMLVLVGNNMDTDQCEKALKNRNLLFGFQVSAGHREGGTAVVGRLPVTELAVGKLFDPAEKSDVEKLNSAFGGKGIKIMPVSSMYAYYMYHIAEIMPYAYLCYHLDCELKKAGRKQIRMIIDASKECFQYLKGQGIPVTPDNEDDFYFGGAKTTAMYLLYRIMAKTILGKLMVSDHCRNGLAEMKYLDHRFENYRKLHPGMPMPVWDSMRAWTLPVFEK